MSNYDTALFTDIFRQYALHSLQYIYIALHIAKYTLQKTETYCKILQNTAKYFKILQNTAQSTHHSKTTHLNLNYCIKNKILCGSKLTQISEKDESFMSRCAEKESVCLACTRTEVDRMQIGQEKQSHNSHS